MITKDLDQIEKKILELQSQADKTNDIKMLFDTYQDTFEINLKVQKLRNRVHSGKNLSAEETSEINSEIEEINIKMDNLQKNLDDLESKEQPKIKDSYEHLKEEVFSFISEVKEYARTKSKESQKKALNKYLKVRHNLKNIEGKGKETLKSFEKLALNSSEKLLDSVKNISDKLNKYMQA